MAKRRENAVADSITKKLKQVQKATSNGAKPRAKKKTDAGRGNLVVVIVLENKLYQVDR